MDELNNVDAELEEPHVFLKDLKLSELDELLAEIDAFPLLERDVNESEERNTALLYWNSLYLATRAEIQLLRSSPNSDKEQSNSQLYFSRDVQSMFEGQSKPALDKMKEEVESKVKNVSWQVANQSSMKRTGI